MRDVTDCFALVSRYGLKIGKDAVFHGIQCPKQAVLAERTRYGDTWHLLLTKDKGGSEDGGRPACRCRVRPSMALRPSPCYVM